jgi:D-lactate dehydrogenase
MAVSDIPGTLWAGSDPVKVRTGVAPDEPDVLRYPAGVRTGDAAASPSTGPGLSPAAREILGQVLPPDRLLTRPIDRTAFASDASLYRLVPQAVAFPASIDEVRGLLAAARSCRLPVTFRAAGTSLSGQAVTDGLLVEVQRYWRGVRIEDGGRRVRVQPGVIGGRLNRLLAPCGTRIGPDPASIDACAMGGILANNSSGMCCGVAQNAYRTLESLTFVLPSGTTIDTASPDADATLRAREPALAEGLLALRYEIEANAPLRDRIRTKYRMKNTTGYSLNAFLDYTRPVDILAHLLIGSEGTLAFIAEAVLRTVPELPVRHTGLLLFPDLHAACRAIGPLAAAGAAALELMDRASLAAVARRPGMPPDIAHLPPGAAAILAEFRAADEAARPALATAARSATAGLSLLEPPAFTDDPAEQVRLWAVRKGLFPSVGAVRRTGTTVLIEDIAVPVDRLAEAALDLTALFAHHGYGDAIIFGHARDGNLHFVLSQSFRDEAAVAQYARFMDDVVRLVVGKYDGALKAEHGTGRNMAPFVEAEWGAEALAIMRRLKALADPDGLLNPGVILNPDPRAHLRDLKPLPAVEPEVDRCIECGFCEPHCPSRDLTLTPRQRIVVRREIVRLEGLPDGAPHAAALAADFPYMALDTCAVDGLCATACPVDIDTGQLTKRFRAAAHGPRARRLAAWCAEHLGLVERAVRLGLAAGHACAAMAGPAAVDATVRAIGRLGLPLPRWIPPMPRPARWRPAPLPPDSGSGPLRVGHALASAATDAHEAAVYFPTCIDRAIGPLPGEPRDASPGRALAALAARAGVRLVVPRDAAGLCCGVPFSSKGFDAAHSLAASRLVDHLWSWSHAGRLPIVIDTSPCVYGLLASGDCLPAEARARLAALRVTDAVAFAHDVLLPRLTIRRRARRVVLHPVCSIVKMGLAPALEAVARAAADEVVVPQSAGCCGFAGDRGLLVPELTAAATRALAAEVRAIDADGWYATSRTCEIGLTRATGRTYRSVLYLLEEATREE